MKFKLAISIILLILCMKVQSQENAFQVLENALEKAKNENKNVFFKFGSTWCQWCVKMDKKMQLSDFKTVFEDNYVIADIILFELKKNKDKENPKALELIKKYKYKKSGIPFWVFLDNEGNIIGDSFNNEGKNMGYPAKGNELDKFISILKKTSNISDKNLDLIANILLSK